MSLFLPWWLTAYESFISCPLTTMEQVAPQACAGSIHERFWKSSSEQSGVILELVWLWSRHFWKSVPDWVAIPWPHEKLNTWFRWDPDTREATCCSFKTVRDSEQPGATHLSASVQSLTPRTQTGDEEAAVLPYIKRCLEPHEHTCLGWLNPSGFYMTGHGKDLPQGGLWRKTRR